MILRNITHALIISLGRNRNEVILEENSVIRHDCKNILYHKLYFLITDENVSTIYYTAKEKIEFVVMENKTETTHGR